MSELTRPLDHHSGPRDSRPKVPVQLDQPKEAPMTYEELSEYNGMIFGYSPLKVPVKSQFLTQYAMGTDTTKPILVAVKGAVFDVTRNSAYEPGWPYHGSVSCTW